MTDDLLTIGYEGTTIDAVIEAGLDAKQLAAFLAAVKSGIQFTK